MVYVLNEYISDENLKHQCLLSNAEFQLDNITIPLENLNFLLLYSPLVSPKSGKLEKTDCEGTKYADHQENRSACGVTLVYRNGCTDSLLGTPTFKKIVLPP